MCKSPQFTQPLTLIPIDFWDENEVEEFVKQRKICGWDHEKSDIEDYRETTRRGVKTVWWIVVPGGRAGHIGLASEACPPDPDLARADRSVLTVTSFFVLPEYRATGVGRAGWLEVENRARQIPECREIAIDTMDRRYVVDPGPEWGGLLRGLGISVDERAPEDWYARMGYISFKHVPRYPLAGGERLMVATYMRRRIK